MSEDLSEGVQRLIDNCLINRTAQSLEPDYLSSSVDERVNPGVTLPRQHQTKIWRETSERFVFAHPGNEENARDVSDVHVNLHENTPSPQQTFARNVRKKRIEILVSGWKSQGVHSTSFWNGSESVLLTKISLCNLHLAYDTGLRDFIQGFFFQASSSWLHINRLARANPK